MLSLQELLRQKTGRDQQTQMPVEHQTPKTSSSGERANANSNANAIERPVDVGTLPLPLSRRERDTPPCPAERDPPPSTPLVHTCLQGGLPQGDLEMMQQHFFALKQELTSQLNENVALKRRIRDLEQQVF